MALEPSLLNVNLITLTSSFIYGDSFFMKNLGTQFNTNGTGRISRQPLIGKNYSVLVLNLSVEVLSSAVKQ